ncbi:MAG TPA: hypothetical protein VMS64_13070 [Candidatus Methylomirabilis sp.]|nr:hypothetical protein [Candidatus Methylomirabilis sp.]
MSVPGWWRARPVEFSRRVWLLMHALDLLPWPCGEQILAWLFMGVGLARRGVRSDALAWASAQRARSTWRLALAVLAFRGRWLARTALIGIRSPGQLRRHLVVRGEEHLASTSGGAILLGFHLGPPGADVALRAVGHRLVWLGGTRRVAAGWRRDAWRPYLHPGEHLSADEQGTMWPALLHRAHRIILGGGRIFVMADGGGAQEVHHISLPGEDMPVRAGWLALHRHSGVRVLPVLTHLEGRTQVVTIHPPLPMRSADGAGDCRGWQAILTSLVADYVHRFPEQCFVLAFRAMFRADALRSSAMSAASRKEQR